MRVEKQLNRGRDLLTKSSKRRTTFFKDVSFSKAVSTSTKDKGKEKVEEFIKELPKRLMVVVLESASSVMAMDTLKLIGGL